VAADALLQTNPRPGRAEIMAALDGHLCRCGSHNRIIRSIEDAAR
jgi:nicotinate dehydrogenase subunit A